MLLAAACSASESPETGDSSSAGSTSTTPGTSSDGATTGDGTTVAMDTSTSDPATTGMPTTDPDTTASDTGPMPLRLCSLEALDPSADPAAVIEYGDGEGQIPTVIGENLLRNCGCHYTDEIPPGFVDYQGNVQPMATWADFHANFLGILPMGFGDMPAHVAVNERVVNMMPLPMPAIMCQVEGEPGLITMADLALFTEWFAAGAPDGANFP